MDNKASPPETIKRRRKYTREFKQRALTESCQPGASLASVAVRYGLNPNMAILAQTNGMDSSSSTGIDVPD
ncbi:MAG: transposase [Granulosicoccaceae bacterium]